MKIEKSRINFLKEKLELAYTRAALIEIVTVGLDVTQRLKES